MAIRAAIKAGIRAEIMLRVSHQISARSLLSRRLQGNIYVAKSTR